MSTTLQSIFSDPDPISGDYTNLDHIIIGKDNLPSINKNIELPSNSLSDRAPAVPTYLITGGSAYNYLVPGFKTVDKTEIKGGSSNQQYWYDNFSNKTPINARVVINGNANKNYDSGMHIQRQLFKNYKVDDRPELKFMCDYGATWKPQDLTSSPPYTKSQLKACPVYENIDDGLAFDLDWGTGESWIPDVPYYSNNVQEREYPPVVKLNDTLEKCTIIKNKGLLSSSVSVEDPFNSNLIIETHETVGNVCNENFKATCSIGNNRTNNACRDWCNDIATSNELGIVDDNNWCNNTLTTFCKGDTSRLFNIDGDQECSEKWCVDNPEVCENDRMDYCWLGDNMQNNNCKDFCDKNPGICDSKLIDYCEGNKLNDIVCQNFCKSTGKCTTNLLNYCKDVSSATNEDGSVKEMCACYMSDIFYSDFYNKLGEKIGHETVATLGNRPVCTFPPCSKVKDIWTNTDTCPAITACFNKISLDGDGISIDNLDQDNDCSTFISEGMKVQECQNSLCESHGTCTNSGDCVCNNGYSGKYCTQDNSGENNGDDNEDDNNEDDNNEDANNEDDNNEDANNEDANNEDTQSSFLETIKNPTVFIPIIIIILLFILLYLKIKKK